MAALQYSTPDFSHLSVADYDHVYEPAEDTFLMLDALEKDAQYLQNLNPAVVMEVGSGSGLVSTHLMNILGPHLFYIGTDINQNASRISEKTAQQNGYSCFNPVIMDLVSALCPRLHNQVDVLIFNPPYVVTPSEEVGSHSIEAAWAGGRDGREVMDRLFPQVPLLLSKQGVFYLVALRENKPDEIAEIMESYGLNSQVALSRQCGREHLSILKFTR